MDVFASGQDHRVPDRVSTWTRFHVATLQGLCEGSQLIVHHYLLQADLQVVKDGLHLFLVRLLEAGTLQELDISTCHETRANMHKNYTFS